MTFWGGATFSDGLASGLLPRWGRGAVGCCGVAWLLLLLLSDLRRDFMVLPLATPARCFACVFVRDQTCGMRRAGRWCGWPGWMGLDGRCLWMRWSRCEDMKKERQREPHGKMRVAGKLKTSTSQQTPREMLRPFQKFELHLLSIHESHP